jgi:hypothetical protein
LNAKSEESLSKGSVVPALTRESQLKRRLRTHLSELGFRKADDGTLILPGTGKDVIRSLHRGQRVERIQRSREFIDERLPGLLKCFASGTEIDPRKISPRLQRVYSGTQEADLFRLASLTWSVPVSNGFGRRLRYLVWDENNGKLIGLVAIGDPVFNLSVRDSLIGWDVKDRSKRLVNMLDAYVLGAVPPYNLLLGGKLVASLLRTTEVYNDFAEAYGGSKGIISKEKKKARLLAITTTSSMGRSSLYNRLSLDGIEYFRSIGYTGGWGHFHIPDDLFIELRDYLRDINHAYADKHKFGEGPNWRLRTTRAALHALGFKEDIMKHGIQREVFFCEMATNSIDLLRGEDVEPNLSTLFSEKEVGEAAVARWMTPRAERRPEYREWRAVSVPALIEGNLKQLPLLDVEKK